MRTRSPARSLRSAQSWLQASRRRECRLFRRSLMNLVAGKSSCRATGAADFRAERSDPAVAHARCEPGLARWVPCRLRAETPWPDAGSLSDDVGSTLMREPRAGSSKLRVARLRDGPRKGVQSC